MKIGAKKEANEDFPILGVGPKIVLIFTPFLIIFGLLNSILSRYFIITTYYYWMVIIGLILIIIGVLIFIYSEKLIKSAHTNSELVTSKIYAYIRHPMYAIWGLIMLPGLLCLFNSWFLFLLLPIYYTIVRYCIRKEETYLLSKFGEVYAHYKKNVNAFFPKFKKYKPKQK
ncbi:MAG: methyltransferase family protein [Candidatus Thorarchaeota archaeon]